MEKFLADILEWKVVVFQKLRPWKNMKETCSKVSQVIGPEVPSIYSWANKCKEKIITSSVTTGPKVWPVLANNAGDEDRRGLWLVIRIPDYLKVTVCKKEES